jgi:predicted phage tail protein
MTEVIGTEQLREVRLYGHLAKQFGKVHVVAVHTSREAAQALAAIVPGFGQALLEHGAGFHVFAGQRDRHGEIREDRLDAPLGRGEPVCIVPVIAGAKRGGLFQIILGAAILIFAPYAAGFLTTLGSTGISAAMIVASYSGTVGLALIMGGVVQALTPSPRNGGGGSAKNDPSFAFGGPVNISEQGVAIPVRYGRGIWGSVVVSQGLSAAEFEPATSPAPTFAGPWPYTWMPQHVYHGAA